MTAVQAGAPRAAAQFTGQHDAVPVIVSGDAEVSLLITGRPGPGAARIRAAAAAPYRASLTSGMHASGEPAGRSRTISACISTAGPEGQPA